MAGYIQSVETATATGEEFWAVQGTPVTYTRNGNTGIYTPVPPTTQTRRRLDFDDMENDHVVLHEVIDINKGATQSNSNTVIFEMMNFYKRKLEACEQQNEDLNKRLRISREEHMHDVHVLERQLNTQVNTNMMFAQTNMRQAETVMRKHQAAVRMARCFDELSAAVELVEETHIGGDEAIALRYIYMKKEELMQRANVAMQMLIAPTQEETEEDIIRMMQIEQEIIDLTAEETEEEETEEEEESDEE